MIRDPVRVNDLRPRWTTRLVGPRGLPRTRRQDAMAPLLQPTFTSRALDIDSTSGDYLPGAVGNPASVQLRGPSRAGEVLPPSVRGAPDHLAVIRPPAAACLTARPPASVRSTFPHRRSRAPRGELRRFFGLPDALSIDPSGTSLPAAGGLPGERGRFNRLISAHRERVNAGGYAGIEVPSVARGRSGRSCESPSRRAAPAGRPAQLPRVFTGVRRHRLDLSSRCFRSTSRGRTRPYDFCRWMSPRARPRTTRASRSAESAVGTTAMARSEVALPIEAAAGGAQGQGSGQPMPDIPGRDCSRRRLGPNPDRSGHLVSRDAVPRRSGATR